MQVQLPAALKANTQKTGAGIKESEVISSDSGHLEAHLKAHLPGKMGDYCLKAHLHISIKAEVVRRREEKK